MSEYAFSAFLPDCDHEWKPAQWGRSYPAAICDRCNCWVTLTRRQFHKLFGRYFAKRDKRRLTEGGRG